MGEDIVGNINNFIEIIYNNDSEKWAKLKRLYRYKNNPYLQERLDYLYSGEQNFIPSYTIMTNTKTIARAGSSTVLRGENQSISEYGGNPGEWKKRVGKIESEKYIFDVHWYELNGRQYKTKVKNRKERS